MKFRLKQTNSEEKILLENGYKLGNKLGEGAYAKVYLCEFKHGKGNDVLKLACKIIDGSNAPKKFLTKFFPRELSILRRLDHPHIVPVHSIFQRKQKYFIFMRFAEQGDLLEFVLKNGAIKERQARVWVRQLSLALQYMHVLEIAHRDIKCENILLTSKFNVKLSDFGFSRYLLRDDGRRDYSETFCGSLSYTSPEILKGDAYDPKISDMWSFGVVIFVMLNKAYPFEDQELNSLYERQTRKKWKFRTRYEQKFSGQVKTLTSQLLEPDIRHRLNIEEVLSSEWISMDKKLKTMNHYEFESLKDAVLESRSRGVHPPQDGYSFTRRSTQANVKKESEDRTFNFIKQIEKDFATKLDVSEFGKKRKSYWPLK